MTILVDMDDVLETLVPAWVRYLNDHYGTDAKPEDVKDWDMTKAFPSLSYEQVYSAEYDESLWDLVRPVEGADETLRKLMDEGHEIYVVTATEYKTLKAKMENALFKYYPYIDWAHVIVTRNKHLINGDVLIDDGIHNLAGGSYKKILFDCYHNQSIDESSVGAVRARGWDEVYEFIKKWVNESEA